MSIAQAQHWLKLVKQGQPLHRDDLGEENKSSGALRGISPAALQLAPQLQRELTQELENAPKPEVAFTPPSFGPGGTSGGGASLNLQNRQPKPPTGNNTTGE